MMAMDQHTQDRVQKKVITIGERWLQHPGLILQPVNLGRRWRQQGLRHQDRYRSHRALAGATRTDTPAPVAPDAIQGDLAALSLLLPQGSDGKPAHAPARPLESPVAESRRVHESVIARRTETTKPARHESGTADVPVGVLRQNGLSLHPSLQQALTRLLGFRVPEVTIHVNPVADEITRRHRADAMAFGSHLLFRTEKYEPESAEGLGLLAHEVTHAAQFSTRLVSTDMVTAPTRIAREESAALASEHSVVRQVLDTNTVWLQSTTVPNEAEAVSSSTLAARPPTSPAQIRSASSDRLPPVSPSRSEPLPLTERQLRQIKEAVYRDLLSRFRTEFERGG